MELSKKDDPELNPNEFSIKYVRARGRYFIKWLSKDKYTGSLYAGLGTFRTEEDCEKRRRELISMGLKEIN